MTDRTYTQAERAAFEAFAERWTGRTMGQLVASGMWGIGMDSFAWDCWKHAKAAERERCAALCDGLVPVIEASSNGVRRDAAIAAVWSCARIIRENT
jgi:hypothetical protein